MIVVPIVTGWAIACALFTTAWPFIMRRARREERAAEEVRALAQLHLEEARAALDQERARSLAVAAYQRAAIHEFERELDRIGSPDDIEWSGR